MVKHSKHYKQAYHTRSVRILKSHKKSIAAKKGWKTRTRKEGMRELTKIVVGIASGDINKARTIKDIVVNTIKIAKPDLYLRCKTLKKLDRL